MDISFPGGVMTVRSLLATIMLLACATALVAFRASSSEETTIVLRVTSATPGTAVTFKGAYVFEGGSLQVVERATPFEVTGNGPLALGIFERQGSGPDLKVEVLRQGQPVPRAEGTSARVIVGNELAGSQIFARDY
jgi:hypothetical protein